MYAVCNNSSSYHKHLGKHLAVTSSTMSRALMNVCCLCFLFETIYAECSFNLDSSTSQRHIPLVLKSLNETLNIPLLTGYITVQNGEQIYLLCSGPGNYLKPNFSSLVTATCHNGKFTLNSDKETTYKLDYLECQKEPQSEASNSSKICNINYYKISIGFRVTSKIFIPKLELCFDRTNLTTYWSKHSLQTPDIRQDNTKEEEYHSFRPDYFLKANPKTAYPNTGYDRGHLIPQGDFYTNPEKKMTFYYVNAVPQIANFNRINWRTLEGTIRSVAFSRRKFLTVYTGATGINFYLVTTPNNLIPVPEYIWKVIIDKTNGNGVAFVGINNVVHSVPNPCGKGSDICQKLKWLKGKILANRKIVEYGKIYCCTIQSFKTITGLVSPDMNEFSGELLQYL